MKRILAVDDSAPLRARLAEHLGGAGCDVDVAADGVEALAILAERRPDMAITDLNMPRMDGLDFIAAARATPEGEGLPILLLTSETGADLKRRARALRATLWLAKPMDGAALAALVERLA